MPSNLAPSLDPGRELADAPGPWLLADCGNEWPGKVAGQAPAETETCPASPSKRCAADGCRRVVLTAPTAIRGVDWR